MAEDLLHEFVFLADFFSFLPWFNGCNHDYEDDGDGDDDDDDIDGGAKFFGIITINQNC